MVDFEIDRGFTALYIELGRLDLSHRFLINNSALPCFIVIPETAEVAFCNLERDR